MSAISPKSPKIKGRYKQVITIEKPPALRADGLSAFEAWAENHSWAAKWFKRIDPVLYDALSKEGVQKPKPDEPKTEAFLRWNEKWNRGTLIKTRDCFRIACDTIEPDMSNLEPGDYTLLVPEPGAMSGKPLPYLWHLKSLRKALESDKWIPIAETDPDKVGTKPGHYLVAGYMGFGFGWFDYHFYVRDEASREWFQGGWDKPVTGLDCSGKKITNPQLADRGIHPNFVGLYWLPDGGIPMKVDITRNHGLIDKVLSAPSRAKGLLKKARQHWGGPQ